jgi:hypothetical protein
MLTASHNGQTGSGVPEHFGVQEGIDHYLPLCQINGDDWWFCMPAVMYLKYNLRSHYAKALPMPSFRVV